MARTAMANERRYQVARRYGHGNVDMLHEARELARELCHTGRQRGYTI